MITLSAMLQSFVLQVGDQYPLFSGGPVWLQLGTAFATWRGRDISSVTRVTPSLDMHSLAHADLWGTRHTGQNGFLLAIITSASSW